MVQQVAQSSCNASVLQHCMIHSYKQFKADCHNTLFLSAQADMQSQAMCISNITVIFSFKATQMHMYYHCRRDMMCVAELHKLETVPFQVCADFQTVCK